MTQKRLWIAAAIIALIIFLSFALSVPHTTRETIKSPEAKVETPAVPTVALRDVFKKGTHTITGSIMAPNACTTVTATASLTGTASTTQTIAVALAMPSDTGLCLQLPTPTNFSATVAAPALLPIVVTVNGAVASTTPL